MDDRLSKKRRPLAGWVWSNTRNMNFNTIFCPFAGWPNTARLFKEEGKGVIATDLLKFHYYMAHSMLENDATAIDPFDLDILLENNPEHPQLMEGQCNAYGLAPSIGAWLDNLHANILKLDDPLKQSMAMAVGIRMIRYFASFTRETAALHDEDPAGSFQYYVEFMNQKIFANELPCEVHDDDAHQLVSTVETDAMYFYMPSSVGLSQLAPDRRMLELFANYCSESALDRRLAKQLPGTLGGLCESMEQYQQAFESFLDQASHIPIWIIAYSEMGLIPHETFEGTLKKFKKNVLSLSKQVMHSGREVVTEYLFIAHP